MRAATMTRAGAVELEDSAETLRDAPPRRRRRRSRDGKPAEEETSAANDGDGAIATLSWCESACATVVGALAVRVRKGEMSSEDDVAVRVGHVGDFVGVQGAVHRVADG